MQEIVGKHLGMVARTVNRTADTEASMTLSCGPAVEAIIEEFAADRSRLLDIVEQVQRRFGHIGDGAIQAMPVSPNLSPRRQPFIDTTRKSAPILFSALNIRASSPSVIA